MIPKPRSALEVAKQVLAANERVLYGIFGVVGSSGLFPPQALLNEFLMRGHDPCDQDRRMAAWKPFTVSAEEYRELKAWWVAGHANAVEDALGVDGWDEWVQQMLNR